MGTFFIKIKSNVIQKYNKKNTCNEILKLLAMHILLKTNENLYYDTVAKLFYLNQNHKYSYILIKIILIIVKRLQLLKE
jgi:hypothetical protein